jgi:hypothetical protein
MRCESIFIAHFPSNTQKKLTSESKRRKKIYETHEKDEDDKSNNCDAPICGPSAKSAKEFH